LQHLVLMVRLVGILMLVGGCVADVGDPAPPSNPIPPGGGQQGQGSDEDNGESGSQSEVSATDYLTEIAMIQCEQAFSCRATYPNDAAAFEASWKTSVAACVANLQIAWGSNQIETEIAKGRIDFDGTAAVSCLGGVAFGSCDTHWTSGIQWAPSCYSVMNGNVQVGGNCDSLYSCTSYNCDLVEQRCI
jgi:hypothetical protein